MAANMLHGPKCSATPIDIFIGRLEKPPGTAKHGLPTGDELSGSVSEQRSAAGAA